MQELTGRNQRRPRAVLTRALSWLVAGIGVLVPMASVGAEVPVHRWGLGLESGVLKLQDGAWDYSAADQFGRLRLGRGLSRHWSLHLAWTQGHVRTASTRAANRRAGRSTRNRRTARCSASRCWSSSTGCRRARSSARC
jgi:hypothetical protein